MKPSGKIIIKEQKGRSHGKTGEGISGWLEEPGKHLSPPCPWEVAFERRLEAFEGGRRFQVERTMCLVAPGKGFGVLQEWEEA